MDMKDYYQILGVEKDASEQEIRRRYRKLAMQYHPDQNQGVADAEEKFKEIAEAYGVLTDPIKRKEYDNCLRWGGTGQSQQGFSYSQQEIFEDLFKNEQFQQMFQGILREFQKSGLRASPQFISQSFFGGKGRLFLGGLFLFGTIAGSSILKDTREKLPPKESVMKTLGRKVGKFLSVEKQPPIDSAEFQEKNDIVYKMDLTDLELEQGKVVQLQTVVGRKKELLKIKIPKGSRPGQKLRLKGKGNAGPNGLGDLYLELRRKGR